MDYLSCYTPFFCAFCVERLIQDISKWEAINWIFQRDVAAAAVVATAIGALTIATNSC